MPLNVMRRGPLPGASRNRCCPLHHRSAANIGVLAMKSLGGTGVIVKEAGVAIEDAGLRYVTLIAHLDARCRESIFGEGASTENLKIVREFRPMTLEERAAVEGKTLALAGDGRFELFKSSKMFDGPVHRNTTYGFSTQVS